MKKIFLAISMCFVCVISFGQLNATSKQDTYNYKTVYILKYLGCKAGEIRYYKNDGFVFISASDNQYENTSLSIFLGKTKNETIQSLRDIKNLQKNLPNEHLYVNGYHNPFDEKTVLYAVGFCLAMKCKYIAGISYGPGQLGQLSNKKFSELETIINNF